MGDTLKPVTVRATWAPHVGACSACQNPCEAGVKVMAIDSPTQRYVLYCRACAMAIVTALYQNMSGESAQ